MNILPHKSWHVYSRKNRERVARDERQYHEELERKRKREQELEQEQRYEELKERARKRQKTDSSSTDPASIRHINFFEAEEKLEKERADSTYGLAHPERVAEEREEQLRKLRQTTAFLGQGSAELQDIKPWWYSARSPASTEEDAAKQRKQERKKEQQDPLAAITQALKNEKHSHLSSAPTPTKSSTTPTSTPPKQPTPIPASNDTLDRLRRERLAREREEQERVRRLLTARHSGSINAAPTPRVVTDERCREYNNSYARYTRAERRH